MHLGKCIKASPPQYLLNNILMIMCSESVSMKELGPEHQNLCEKAKRAAENWVESMTVEERCSEGISIQSGARWHGIICVHYSRI